MYFIISLHTLCVYVWVCIVVALLHFLFFFLFISLVNRKKGSFNIFIVFFFLITILGYDFKCDITTPLKIHRKQQILYENINETSFKHSDRSTDCLDSILSFQFIHATHTQNVIVLIYGRIMFNFFSFSAIHNQFAQSILTSQ